MTSTEHTLRSGESFETGLAETSIAPPLVGDASSFFTAFDLALGASSSDGLDSLMPYFE